MLLLLGYRIWGLHQDLELENSAPSMSEEDTEGAVEERLADASGHRFDDASISTWIFKPQFLADHDQRVVG